MLEDSKAINNLFDCATFLLILAVFSLNVFFFHGVLEGDGLISIIFGRNMAAGYFFHYNIGTPSSASTSPLWCFAIACLAFFFDGDALILSTKILAFTFLSLSALGVYHIARLLGTDKKMSLKASLVWCTTPFLLYWTFSAMESSLLCAIISGAIFLLLSACWTNNLKLYHLFFLGALLGLLPLARPETGLITAVSYAILIYRVFRKQLSMFALLIVMLSTAIVVLPYYTSHYLTFGTFFSSSSSSRLAVTRLDGTYFLGILFSPDAFGILLMQLPLGVLAFSGIARQLKKGREEGDRASLERCLAIVTGFWSIFSIFFFSFVYTSTWGGRYLIPMIVLWYFIAAVGLHRLHKNGRKRILSNAFLVLILICNAGAGFFLATRTVFQTAESNKTQKLADLTELAYHVKEGESIIANEVQGAWYIPGLKWISGDGLIDGVGLGCYKEGKTLYEFIKTVKPTYVGTILGPFWRESEMKRKMEESANAKKDFKFKDISFEYIGSYSYTGGVFRVKPYKDSVR